MTVQRFVQWGLEVNPGLFAGMSWGEEEGRGNAKHPEKDVTCFLVVLSLTGKLQCWGIHLCEQVNCPAGPGQETEKLGQARAPSTGWILKAGYVTSLWVLEKHSKQRGKCLNGSLCC